MHHEARAPARSGELSPQIRAHHERVIAHASTMIHGVLNGMVPMTLADLLDDLLELAEEQFLLEESAMLASGYPRHAAHRRDHQRILNSLRLLKSQYVARCIQPRAVAHFLLEWIVNHNEVADRELIDFLHPEPIALRFLQADSAAAGDTALPTCIPC